MAKIPLPERGMPLDVPYIYQLANAINDLATQVTSTTSNYATIFTRVAGKQTLKTSDTKVVAGYVDIVNNSSVNAGDTKDFSFDYNSDFKYAPIATATAVNTGNTTVGNNVSIVITSVTTSRVDGRIYFNSGGVVSVTVNVIVVGVPT